MLVEQKQAFDEAVNLYRDAIEVRGEARPKYDTRVFHSYIKIGDILKGQNKPDEAYKEYQIAAGIALTAAEKAPGSTIWQRNLGSAIIKGGDLLVEQKRRPEALDHYQQALQFVESLAAKHPNIPEWAALARSLQDKIDALRI